ncbi:MAG: hypothetical protein ACLR0N_12150 [Bilophila wadsworthia]
MKKLSAKRFQYAIADIAAALQQQIEADCEGFRPIPRLPQSAGNGRLPISLFRRTYFPHYCTIAGDSALHTWLDAALRAWPKPAKASISPCRPARRSEKHIYLLFSCCGAC